MQEAAYRTAADQLAEDLMVMLDRRTSGQRVGITSRNGGDRATQLLLAAFTLTDLKMKDLPLNSWQHKSNRSARQARRAACNLARTMPPMSESRLPIAAQPTQPLTDVDTVALLHTKLPRQLDDRPIAQR